MKPYRLGVIGIGDISAVYLNNLKKYPEVVTLYGCACRSLEKAQRKAAEYGFLKAYPSGDALIADPDIDVVLNLTIPAAHYDYNKKALEAGKHVYSEKPLAATFAQARELIDIAEKNNLKIGCAPDTFMGGRLQTYRDIIDSGKIGKVFGGTATMLGRGWDSFHPSSDFYYQPGAGPLLDMGPYYLHALFSLIGPVERVSAMASQTESVRKIDHGPRKGQEIHVDPSVMTYVTANLHFRSGAIVTLIVSFDIWDSAIPRFEIYGTKGTLCMLEEDPCDGPNLFGGKVLIRTPENYRWYDMPRKEEDLQKPWKEIPVTRGHNSTTQAENSRGIGLVDMLLSLQEQRPFRATGRMAAHAMEVMEGILTSARENRFVEMTTDFAQPAPLPEDF